MLEAKPLNKIDGYAYLESLKTNKKYLKEYKKVLIYNSLQEDIASKIGANVYNNDVAEICIKVYKEILKQDIDKIVKRQIKDLLDEFSRVSRCMIDNREWTSGMYLTSDDFIQKDIIFGMFVENCKDQGSRIPNAKINAFIRYFSNDYEYNNKFDNDFKICHTGLTDEYIVLDRKAYHFNKEKIENTFSMRKHENGDSSKKLILKR